MSRIAICASIGGLKPFPAVVALVRELEQRGLRNQVVAYAGSSGGSIPTALAASGMSGSDMEKVLLSITSKSQWEDYDFGYPITALIKSFTFHKPLAGFTGLISGNKIRRWLQQYLQDKTFNNLPTPLYIAAYDINCQMPRVFSPDTFGSTRVVQAVRGSTAIPLGFRHETISLPDGKDHGFWDGGITSALPLLEVIRSGNVAPDFIFAIDAAGATDPISPEPWESIDKKSVFEMITAGVLSLSETANALHWELAKKNVPNIYVLKVRDGASMSNPGGTIPRAYQTAQEDAKVLLDSLP